MGEAARQNLRPWGEDGYPDRTPHPRPPAGFLPLARANQKSEGLGPQMKASFPGHRAGGGMKSESGAFLSLRCLPEIIYCLAWVELW